MKIIIRPEQVYFHLNEIFIFQIFYKVDLKILCISRNFYYSEDFLPILIFVGINITELVITGGITIPPVDSSSGGMVFTAE
jgi:hypothetical protein